jgi:hypothetical protein
LGLAAAEEEEEPGYKNRGGEIPPPMPMPIFREEAEVLD